MNSVYVMTEESVVILCCYTPLRTNIGVELLVRKFAMSRDHMPTLLPCALPLCFRQVPAVANVLQDFHDIPQNCLIYVYFYAM